MAELVNKIGSYTPDGLIGGCEIPALTEVVIIPAGAGKLPRGRILGKIISNGKFNSVDSSKTDGTEKADRILKCEVDATSVDVRAETYSSGQFNKNYLSCGGTDRVDQHADALRDKNIYLTREA